MSNKQYPLLEKLLRDYDKLLDRDGVSGARLAARLHEIAQIGLTEDNGSNRPGFSKAERAAKELVIGWMELAGLQVTTDGAGNVFGRFEGSNQSKKTILSGSHVDSVPNGGHFDGPLGVLVALEVVESWRETNYIPERSFEVVIFSDEEGARFNSGFTGSKAVVQSEDLAEITTLSDFAGTPFNDVLASVGLSKDTYVASARDFSKDELYIEVHIEQGKRLEKENLPCGIVTGIAGPYWVEYIFYGEAGHAGNTPMQGRKDALVTASEFIQQVQTIPPAISDTAVATVGQIEVKPNGVNIIPGEVRLMVDGRDITTSGQRKLVQKIKKAAETIAEAHGTPVDITDKIVVDPVEMDEDLQKVLEEVFIEAGIEPYYLPSGAGHDAMIIGMKVPVAMLFVQSKDGISHHPDEWTYLNDAVQAVHLLKRFLEKMQ